MAAELGNVLGGEGFYVTSCDSHLPHICLSCERQKVQLQA